MVNIMHREDVSASSHRKRGKGGGGSHLSKFLCLYVQHLSQSQVLYLHSKNLSPRTDALTGPYNYNTIKKLSLYVSVEL